MQSGLPRGAATWAEELSGPEVWGWSGSTADRVLFRLLCVRLLRTAPGRCSDRIGGLPPEARQHALCQSFACTPTDARPDRTLPLLLLLLLLPTFHNRRR